MSDAAERGRVGPPAAPLAPADTRAAPICPFCERAGAELVSAFASQIITSQWHCGACGSYFEAVREAFDDAPRGGAATADPTSRPTDR